MKDIVLLGDEAIALGAIHAGLSAGFGYPGTPSTEILEFLIKNKENVSKSDQLESSVPIAQWCSNEKTAYESALGASFAGKRSIVTMKHVGLNVAADPFMNSSLVGINGGLVLIVADDPSMHSSQGEQDSRFFADFAMIPCFEPTTQQEAYEMMFEAFEISEKNKVPVMMRVVTRLAHSRAVVRPFDVPLHIKQANLLKANKLEWMLLPALARKNYEKMIEKQELFQKWSNSNKWNTLQMSKNKSDFAIITSGLGKNYYLENIKDYAEYLKALSPSQELPSHLHIATLPLPLGKIQELTQNAQTLLIIEEGMPVIEKQLKGLLPQKITVLGKLSGHLPRTGELNPDFVRKALSLEERKSITSNPDIAKLTTDLPGRPPQLCRGCPHADSYSSLNKAVSVLKEKAGDDNVVIMSDIGCYALGALSPYNAIESIVCMGASLGMARGAAQVGVKYAFGVIGDSTFLHSGIQNLVDAVSTKTPMTAIILDNSIVAMTGCQETIVPSNKLESLVVGLGVEPEHVRVLSTFPNKIEENTKILLEEAEYRGVSVILLVRECVESLRIKNKAKK
ncbi:MAG TPA: thiamine pyrophosphate-dependent enzyme [Treponemataceae bacterium]|nr:thiamine pyrophosphate-dependent enzyme [Treponemataceae bacterium]HOQ92555.1 thiamine pyrophosphate-dependent enzyme [Treponemataceae bacterium]